MIKLTHNKGFNWYNSGKIWVKGVFFDNTGNIYHNDLMPEYFKKADTFNAFVSILKQCNGIFSVIIESGDEIWVAVDRNISFPLFYNTIDNEIVISDDTEFLINKSGNIKINKLQKSLYRSLGYTVGSSTLIENIYQIENAQAIRFNKEEIADKVFYHLFSVKTFNDKPENELFKEGINAFENSITRLIKSLNGRTAVVPLSGGFDSRWIAAALKKHNYKNVICFTYGKQENNPDLPISKKVAGQLGYKWIFIEYNKKEFADFAESQIFNDYINYSAHLTSMFFLQEYFAVKYLKEKNIIPVDSVFIPGHSGDLIGGSQIIKVFDNNLNINEISSVFIKKKSLFKKLTKQDKNQLKKYINNKIAPVKNNISTTVFEEIDIREKISKMIFNSSLVFDFFGYEKRFPFWDLELLNFFLSLPFEQREMKKLYDRILIEKYFKPLNVYFEEELQPTKKQLIIQHIKNSIKLVLPLPLKLKLLKKSDWKNYHDATMMLYNIMKSNGHNIKFTGNSFNEILIEYYFYLISKK